MVVLSHYLYIFAFHLLVTGIFILTQSIYTGETVRKDHKDNILLNEFLSIHKKINFVVKGNRCTPNPEGWVEYDGSIYNAVREYGWLTNLSGKGRDRGADSTILLTDKVKSSPKDLGRLELANWQGTHQENLPIVFRIDLPDGWYCVTCTSVDPGTTPLPLVNQRCFKCRAQDVVFAGAHYGEPLVISGDQLVEGSGVVEVTDGHLRIVVGDPSYSGWTWSHQGPWYRGWKRWCGYGYQYANGWYQKITRYVDPGFHNLRLNSLEVEQVTAPVNRYSLIFRDFFNRDNNQDINVGVLDANRWDKVKLNKNISDNIETELYQTSIKLTSIQSEAGLIGLLHNRISPDDGTVRYSTRVSLFTGEGSQKHSGKQEAGIIILVEPLEPNEFNATFVGISFDGDRSETMGSLQYRVGDGEKGYRINLEIPDTALPFKITEGEYEIIVEHDVAQNVITTIKINGVDITNLLDDEERKQRRAQGVYGIRSLINNCNSEVNLKQFYWFYRVEKI